MAVLLFRLIQIWICLSVREMASWSVLQEEGTGQIGTLIRGGTGSIAGPQTTVRSMEMQNRRG